MAEQGTHKPLVGSSNLPPATKPRRQGGVLIRTPPSVITGCSNLDAVSLSHLHQQPYERRPVVEGARLTTEDVLNPATPTIVVAHLFAPEPDQKEVRGFVLLRIHSLFHLCPLARLLNRKCWQTPTTYHLVLSHG